MEILPPSELGLDVLSVEQVCILVVVPLFPHEVFDIIQLFLPIEPPIQLVFFVLDRGPSSLPQNVQGQFAVAHDFERVMALLVHLLDGDFQNPAHQIVQPDRAVCQDDRLDASEVHSPVEVALEGVEEALDVLLRVLEHFFELGPILVAQDDLRVAD